MTNQILVTQDNIQQTLGLQDKLVLLSFFSAQHPSCVAQREILARLAEQYQDMLVVATLDCETEAMLASQLAQQIGLQTLPTIVVLKNGAPLDIIAGAKSEEELKQQLAEHLPAPETLFLAEAQNALMAGDLNKAFEFAKKAKEAAPKNDKAKLVFADLCIQLNKLEDAKALLATVAVESQDAYFHNLQAKLHQAEQTEESPEIVALRAAIEAAPTDWALYEQLGGALLASGQKEEALAVLLVVLKKDMAFGEVKKTYLDIIASLPNGDKVAGDYRRKLYSLLY
ncbi:tetratricopeptide repeat protein [Pseudoalteromonas fenneropenaei]|uniref:Tetratricopeptide repeat protein n=1 Tax=Pseudoalteromonas fenneropenaei TaxID=1737459 RepID=A0ABV7CIN4_9GAMM